MTKFKLKPRSGDGKMPPSIMVFYKSENNVIATIWGDGRIVALKFHEYSVEEMEYLVGVAKQFYSNYDSLELIAQKDEVIKEQEAIIRQLQTEMSFMIDNSPINQG